MERRSLKQVEAAAEEGLTVLVFERMDESVVLLLDLLDMPLSTGLVPHAKSFPHPGPEEWPAEAVAGFKNMASRVGSAPPCSESFGANRTKGLAWGDRKRPLND